jgi:putative Mn2+ efflux pump MntP
MGLFEIIMIAVGLSMDAFAVAVCKGLATSRFTLKRALTVGAWFGGFQALMPALGFLLGTSFEDYIKSVDHWVAFVLLTIIGVNMIRESRSCDDEGCDDMSFMTMLLLAVATSIDALAVGISFAFLGLDSIVMTFVLIGVITFVLSAAGFWVGNRFGSKYKSRAELLGGIILILIGLKILLEHLGIIK